MFLFLAIATNFESGTMPMGAYGAKSDMPDLTAPGGFAESKNKSWSMAEVNVEGTELKLIVKKNACCVKGPDCPQIVILSNGGSEPAWFAASDGVLSLRREAKAPNGEWQVIEFRMSPDCGNSLHKVALNPGRAWIWDVPSNSGTFATSGRYVLLAGEKRLESSVFPVKINQSDFVLPDQYRNGFKLDVNGLLIRS